MNLSQLFTQQFQGFTNYETWIVATISDNDDKLLDLKGKCIKDTLAIFDDIEDRVSYMALCLESIVRLSPLMKIFNLDLDKVDWQEISRDLIFWA